MGVERRWGEALVVFALAFVSLYLALGTPLLQVAPALGLFGPLLLGCYLSYRWSLYTDPRFLAAWVAASAVLAVASILTGFWNGLTDEPYGNPAYAYLGWHLYSSPINITYVQYGTPGHLSDYYVYLPLLTFIQVPGLDYRWLAFAFWVLTLLVVRQRAFALLVFGAPSVALLAANGFNDFVPLLFLSLSLLALSGARSWVAQVVSLGLKQFANVALVVYYLLKRRPLAALVALAVTAAWLAPFLYLDPAGVYCRVILTSNTGCGNVSGQRLASPLAFVNYALWPWWVLAAFPGAVRVFLGSLRGRLLSPLLRTAAAK